MSLRCCILIKNGLYSHVAVLLAEDRSRGGGGTGKRREITSVPPEGEGKNRTLAFGQWIVPLSAPGNPLDRLGTGKIKDPELTTMQDQT